MDSSPVIQGCASLPSCRNAPIYLLKAELTGVRWSSPSNKDETEVEFQSRGGRCWSYRGQDRTVCARKVALACRVLAGPLQDNRHDGISLSVVKFCSFQGASASLAVYATMSANVWHCALQLSYPSHTCQRPVTLACTNLTLYGNAGAPKQLSQVLTWI